MIARILVLYHATYDIVHATGKNMHVIIKPLFWEASLYIYISNQKQPSCKKRCGPHKGQGEKRCEIQGGGQEMAVMVG